MDLLKQCATAFSNILAYQYHFVNGRKGIKKEFMLTFDKADFHHLVGLHKLRDITQIQQGMRSKIFDDILNDKINMGLIMKSQFYSEMVMRIEPLIYLEDMLDNNQLVFRYNEKAHKYSLIKADYLLEGQCRDEKAFLFLGEREKGGLQMCRTFFPKSGKDYTQGQPQYTLLKREKVRLSDGMVETQYNRLVPIEEKTVFILIESKKMDWLCEVLNERKAS